MFASFPGYSTLPTQRYATLPLSDGLSSTPPQLLSSANSAANTPGSWGGGARFKGNVVTRVCCLLRLLLPLLCCVVYCVLCVVLLLCWLLVSGT